MTRPVQELLDHHEVKGVFRTVDDDRPTKGWVFTDRPDAVDLKDAIDAGRNPYRARMHERHVRAGGLSLPVYVIVLEKRM